MAALWLDIFLVLLLCSNLEESDVEEMLSKYDESLPCLAERALSCSNVLTHVRRRAGFPFVKIVLVEQ